MSKLELARKQLELEQVKTARKGLEFKILECEDQIERLKEHIKIQLAREAELEKELQGK